MKPELLAPAGNIESLKAAVNSGADAVYLGLGQMNARAKAEGFHAENLAEWVNYANLFGVKIYVTLNTLVKDNEFELCYNLAKAAVEANAEALIVQDMGLMRFLKKHFPETKLHASTQMGIHNTAGALEASRLGAVRTVLSRECSLQDIRMISSVMETEVFVQGALCVAFSGNCYMSSSIFSSSGNRGKCLQPCRKKYRAIQNKECVGEGYLLSPADLCVGDRIFELIEAGVTSFKIEGRLRRSEYTAAAVTYYRDLLDGKNERLSHDYDLLKRMFNRGDYTSGYAFGLNNRKFISSQIQGHLGVPAGSVSDVKRDRLKIFAKESICAGDAFKIVTDGKESGNAVCQNGQDPSWLNYRGRAEKGSLLYKTTDVLAEKELNEICKRIPIRFQVTGKVGLPLELTAETELRVDAIQQINTRCVQRFSATAVGGIVQRAENKAVTQETVYKHLARLQDTPFALERLDTVLDSDCFMPLSELNRLRRELVQQLLTQANALKKPPKVLCKHADLYSTMHISSGLNSQTAAIIRNFHQLNASAIPFDNIVFQPDVYDSAVLKDFLRATKSNTAKKFLALPNYLTNEEINFIYELEDLKQFDGLYCSNLSHLKLVQDLRLTLFASPQFNIFNRYSIAEIQSRFPEAKICASNELNKRELEQLSERCHLFLYSYGMADCMTLLHCPIQVVTKKNCADCQYNDHWSYQDEKFKEFPLIRIKVKQCRFLLKNAIRQNLFVKLNDSSQIFSYLFDLTMDSPQQVEKITNYYLQKFIKYRPLDWTEPFTAGNFMRGV